MEPTTIAGQLREIAIYFDLDGDRHRAPRLRQGREVGRSGDRPAPADRRASARRATRGRTIDRAGDRRSRAARQLRGARRAAREVADGHRRARATALRRRDQGAQASSGARARRSRRGRGCMSRACRPRRARLRRDQRAQDPRGDRGASRARHAGAARRCRGARRRDRGAPARRSSRAGASRSPVPCGAGSRSSSTSRSRSRPTRPDAVIARLESYALVTVVDRGARPRNGAARRSRCMRCDVILAPPAHFGWALIRATGSPEHVELLRARRKSRCARRARRGRRLRGAARAVRAARGSRRRRRSRPRLERARRARRHHDGSALPLDVQRRPRLDRGDGARGARARHGARSRSRITPPPRRTRAGSTPIDCARRHSRSPARAASTRQSDLARHRGGYPGRRHDRRAPASSSASSIS